MKIFMATYLLLGAAFSAPVLFSTSFPILMTSFPQGEANVKNATNVFVIDGPFIEVDDSGAFKVPSRTNLLAEASLFGFKTNLYISTFDLYKWKSVVFRFYKEGMFVASGMSSSEIKYSINPMSGRINATIEVYFPSNIPSDVYEATTASRNSASRTPELGSGSTVSAVMNFEKSGKFKSEINFRDPLSQIACKGLGDLSSNFQNCYLVFRSTEPYVFGIFSINLERTLCWPLYLSINSKEKKWEKFDGSFDIDGDGVSEVFTRYGTSHNDERFCIYRLVKKEYVQVFSTYIGELD